VTLQGRLGGLKKKHRLTVEDQAKTKAPAFGGKDRKKG